MRRITMFSLMAVVIIGGALVGGGLFASAQNDLEPIDSPAQGSWIIDSEPQDVAMSIRHMVLSADGSAGLITTGNTPDGIVSFGVWQPTSETSAIATFRLVTNGPAYITTRVSIEVSEDGSTFTGTFTNEMVFDPSGGGTSGEIGPGTLEGTRMSAEGPGTPVDSFEEFFAIPGATPVATPES